jgi:hypothetical protein
METKICSVCLKEKQLSEFHKNSSSKDGYKSRCVDCFKIYYKEYKEKDSQKIKESKRQTYFKNREYYLKKSHDHRYKNIDKVRERDRLRGRAKYDEKKEYQKKYRENNQEKIKEYKKKYEVNNSEKIKEFRKIRFVERNKTDNIFYLRNKMRTRLYHFISNRNISKNNRTFEMVGCSPEFLKEHLEKQFVDGMSWENKGKWHIDHIIPLSSAKTEEELLKLCHYTNLQPLWAEDNIKKSNKIL